MSTFDRPELFVAAGIDPLAFRRLLGQHNVDLPVAPSQDPDECGVLRDRAGTPVLTIDVNRDRPDAEVTALATWFALAINAAGGFRLDEATAREAAG